MLRTRMDVSGPHHTLSLGPLGARGKLLSAGRLGKPGRWTGGLPHCHAPPGTGASEWGFSKRQRLSETRALDLPMRTV